MEAQEVQPIAETQEIQSVVMGTTEDWPIKSSVANGGAAANGVLLPNCSANVGNGGVALKGGAPNVGTGNLSPSRNGGKSDIAIGACSDSSGTPGDGINPGLGGGVALERR